MEKELNDIKDLLGSYKELHSIMAAALQEREFSVDDFTRKIHELGTKTNNVELLELLLKFLKTQKKLAEKHHQEMRILLMHI